MISNVFLDSSVLVEAIKGRHVEFLDFFLMSDEHICFINETVVSEFLFHVLGTNGGTSPKTLQAGNKLAATLVANPAYSNIFKHVHFLETNASLFHKVPALMIQYNLLPNDAIMLATCKIHGITQLASHDSHFIVPCRQENIELLTEEQFPV